MDLTTPRRPTTHRTKRRKSVGRRERGLLLAVVNSLTLDGRDHSGTPVARWLITGRRSGRWRNSEWADFEHCRLAMVRARRSSLSSSCIAYRNPGGIARAQRSSIGTSNSRCSTCRFEPGKCEVASN